MKPASSHITKGAGKRKARLPGQNKKGMKLQMAAAKMGRRKKKEVRP